MNDFVVHGIHTFVCVLVDGSTQIQDPQGLLSLEGNFKKQFKVWNLQKQSYKIYILEWLKKWAGAGKNTVRVGSRWVASFLDLQPSGRAKTLVPFLENHTLSPFCFLESF